MCKTANANMALNHIFICLFFSEIRAETIAMTKMYKKIGLKNILFMNGGSICVIMLIRLKLMQIISPVTNNKGTKCLSDKASN